MKLKRCIICDDRLLARESGVEQLSYISFMCSSSNHFSGFSDDLENVTEYRYVKKINENITYIVVSVKETNYGGPSIRLELHNTLGNFSKIYEAQIFVEVSEVDKFLDRILNIKALI